MCGIAGLWGDIGQSEGLALAMRMTAAIRHRGPDSSGHWATDGFAFGMQRLSIIDLAGGDQPIWSGGVAGEGIGIIFNGEIYNYRALRAGLEKSGHRFHTQSDTEVVLRLYSQLGLSCLDRLEGMFAFCIFDRAQRRMHLVRDRLGKKPLYYGRVNRQFLFGSEIKAILAVLNAKPSLNLQALYHYLTLRYVPGPDTIWQGIHKLDPGSSLTLDLDTGAVEMKRYWSLRFTSEAANRQRDYVAEFETLFLSAVEKRLLAADVPVGVLLSGGLDSSAISAAAVACGHRDFHTFSIAFDDGGFSELPFARETARHIGSQHHEVVIGQGEFMDFLPEFVRYADEPLADLASIPLYFVSRLARHDVKVVLSGEGADEVLAGYNFEQLARSFDCMKSVDGLPLSHAAIGFAAHGAPQRWRRIMSAFARGGWIGYARERPLHMSHVWSENAKQALWCDSVDFESTDALIQAWYDETTSPHPLDRMQQVYCGSWLVEDLLMKADKMSMATSLELRVPFLDHHLVEWATTLPIEWKVGTKGSGYISKRVLREFSARYLPASILSRPKRGFPVPAYQWLAGSLGARAEDIITGPSSRLPAMFEIDPMRAAVEGARRGQRECAHQVWVLLVLDQWLRVWT
jgi:asparagine synthase (glutamine-hydrolysing)